MSAGLGVAVFIVLRWMIPAMNRGNRIGEVLAQVSVKIAPVVAGFLFFLAILSAIVAWRRRPLVDSQRGFKSSRVLPSLAAAAPVCPQCGAQMVLRTAKRGARAGESFWGCSTYPRCNGTRPVS